MSKARKLPKDDERTKFRATRDVLFEATGIDAEEPVWGAPFRALEALFGEGHAPMEALGVSAKFFEDGTALTKRYHVALQPPCDCWTFGREAVVEQARNVAESLKAPPLVDAELLEGLEVPRFLLLDSRERQARVCAVKRRADAELVLIQ